MNVPETAEKCINCNTSLSGKYCYSCGQKKITAKDKSLGYFISEFFSSLFVADGKVIRTFKELTIRPGLLCRTYIEGNTKQFLSPLKLFFFANLIYFLFPFLNTFSTDLYSQLNQQSYSTIVQEWVTDYLETSSVSEETLRATFNRKASSYGKLLLIILVLLQAAMLKLLFIRRKQLYFVDFLTTSAYFTSFYILILLVFFPGLVYYLQSIVEVDISMMLSNDIFSLFFLALIIFYVTVLLKTAFRIKTGEALLKSVLFTVSIIPSFIIYRFILFCVTFWVVTS